MGKTGVNQSDWNSIVTNAQTTASNIQEPEKVTFPKTTLNVFKMLEAKQDTLKNMVAQYKTVIANETAKMLSAADNIVTEDDQAAKSIQENTGKVKFK